MFSKLAHPRDTRLRISPMSLNRNRTLDPSEIVKFNALSKLWWDPDGKMWPLHRLNELRVPFVLREIKKHFQKKTLQGLRVLDIGCGAGLLSEALAKDGALVTGLDVAEKNIAVAQKHALQEGLAITYIHGAVEDFDSRHSFDIVLNMEVIEHVINFRSFIQQTCHLIGPDGLMFFATINRTYFSWLTTIFGAEYLLGWLPRGTHDWRRYVTPKEARSQLKLAGLTILLETGVAMNPFRRRLFLTKNMGANYMMLATKT